MGTNRSDPTDLTTARTRSVQTDLSLSSARGSSRVLIVDDHPLYCEAMQALLESSPTEFEVVGQAWNSSDALQLTRQFQPDMILLDIELDHGTTSGLDLINQIRRMDPGIKVVIVTGHTDREHLMTAVRLGVHAYLEKDLTPQTLLDAIKQVRDGERVLPNPKDLTVVLEELHGIAKDRERVHSDLSDDEVEMLRLAAAGHNNKSIGQRMFWSEITVKRKMQVVYHKLGVGSRAQAVAAVVRLGFI